MTTPPHPHRPQLSLEESIRQLYNRVERETIGAASVETHVIASDTRIVVVARGLPVAKNAAYDQALRTEFAAELGCRIDSLRTRVSLADDEKMEIFEISRKPL